MIIEGWQNLFQNYGNMVKNVSSSMYQGISNTLPYQNQNNNIPVVQNNTVQYGANPPQGQIGGVNNLYPSYYFPVVFIPFMLPSAIFPNSFVKK